MKRLINTSLLAVASAAVLAAPAARAASTDLILGFNETGVSSDLVLDLGPASSALSGGSITLPAGFVSTFNSLFAVHGSGNTVNMTVAGSAFTSSSSTANALWVSQGSGVALGGRTVVASALATIQNDMNGLIANNALTAGNSTTINPNSASTSFSQEVGLPSDQTQPGTSVAGQLNAVLSLAASSTPIAEELFGFNSTVPVVVGKTTVQTGTLGAMGTFTFDPSANGGQGSLVFAPVPEPTTYGLIAGAGLLVLSLRRQLSQKSA